jgi:hypothetical protein
MRCGRDLHCAGVKGRRRNVVVAIAKSFVDEGWQVCIIGPDVISYAPSEFDKLLALSPALHSHE